jgi:hypothetical protein
MGLGRHITVSVIARDGGGGTSSAPSFTSDPVISGNTWVGQTLTVSNGSSTGSPSPSFTYQWKRDGVDIGSATAQTYLLVEADETTDISCTVTITNLEGSDSATSAAVGPIDAEPPAMTFNDEEITYNDLAMSYEV